MEAQGDYSMTNIEEKRLSELEGIITKNFQGFYEVGCALAEISASKLYRLTHTTFEEYCRERFEVARQTAYQYIEAKKAVDNVRNCGQFKLLPTNEAQVRPLTKLSPDAQIEAWEKVVKSAQFDGGITAKHVSQVVGNILGEILTERTNKMKKEISPVVSQKFTNAIWALVEVVREEVAQPMKAKTRKIMVENIDRVSQLLTD